MNYIERVEKYYDNQEEIISVLTTLANSGEYVFRGFNKQDQLLPVLIRETDYSNVEIELLKEFEQYGSHYFYANTVVDFMSYGQHYGLPTRLLDFTYNPFIALSFALFSSKSNGSYKEKEDKEFYYIRYCKLAENIHLKSVPHFHGYTYGHYESDSISDKCYQDLENYSNCLSDTKTSFFNSYLEGMRNCDYNQGNNPEAYAISVSTKISEQKLCFIDPKQSNQRIIMQQGLFMLPYTLYANEHMELVIKNTAVLKIHRELRDDLLKYLDTLGYNTFRLMPDLSSICSAVTQKVKERRTNKSVLFKKIGAVDIAKH